MTYVEEKKNKVHFCSLLPSKKIRLFSVLVLIVCGCHVSGRYSHYYVSDAQLFQ